MNYDELVSLMIERGQEGVTAGEIALSLPAARERLYDFSLFDSDAYQDDVAIDLGMRGADDRTLGSAAGMVGRMVRSGAIVPAAASSLIPGTGYRYVLEGWSGLPPASRSLPTPAELELTDPVELVAAALLASGPGGMPRSRIAYWGGLDRPKDADPYMDTVWRAAIATLTERGWDIRSYQGLVTGDALIQVAATPDAPMRPPADIASLIEEDRYAWPEHGYLYAPELWAAIEASERSGDSWTGGWGRRNPLPSYLQPQWHGQPVPGGEDKRARLVEWAERAGHQEVAALAVPGSVTLILGSLADPVGLEEIAQRLGRKRKTVDQWRTRDQLPEPAWTVGGRPAWPWAVIEQWAIDTGRLAAAGTQARA